MVPRGTIPRVPDHISVLPRGDDPPGPPRPCVPWSDPPGPPIIFSEGSQIPRVLPVALGDPRGRAEERMLRHVRRVTRGGRRLAGRLGHGPDVMRAGAAADAEVRGAEREGGRGELAEFLAGAGER